MVDIPFPRADVGQKCTIGKSPFKVRYLASICGLTSGASAWPVASVVEGPGSTRWTESNGIPKARTFSQQPVQRGLIDHRAGYKRVAILF